MADGPDIKIGLKTVGDTTGADKVVKAVDAVADETERLAKKSGPDTARAMEDMSDKAHVASWAYYDLENEIKKTARTNDTFSSGQTRVASSSRNGASALLMFSQGLEDAQYGIRGVLNNIPSLVMALGGSAGIAGGISIAAVGLAQIIPLFEKTGEKASDLKEKIQETADAMAARKAAQMQAMDDAIDLEIEGLKLLNQGFDETSKAEQDYAAAAISNAEKIALAQRNINEALGLQIDKKKELRDIAEAESAAREAATQRAIEAEMQRLEKARLDAMLAADKFAETQRAAYDQKADLVQAQAKLEKMLAEVAKVDSLKRAERKQAESDQSWAPSMGNENWASKAQQKKISSPEFQAELEGTRQIIKQLEEAIIRYGDETKGRLGSLEIAFQSAQKKAKDVEGAVEKNIAKLEETLAADNLVARTELLKKTQDQQAKDINEVLAQVETSSEAGKTVRDALTGFARDTTIAANESVGVVANTTSMITQIQTGLATAGINTKQVLAMLEQIRRQEQENAREIKALQTKMGTGETRAR